jgi:hypothetical protein
MISMCFQFFRAVRSRIEWGRVPPDTAGAIKTTRRVPSVCSQTSRMGKEVLFFLYRFAGGSRWSDSLVDGAGRSAAGAEKAGRRDSFMLSVVLVDASHNRVEALRTVTLSPQFTWRLHATIQDQIDSARLPHRSTARRSNQHTRDGRLMKTY